MDWKDFPRTKDRLAIVGFHEATRDKAPFDDPEYEIWGLNEEYAQSWMKRTDRHFQLHPRWDFSRTNNTNHPNHLLWLKNQAGTCIRCKGSTVLGEGDKQIKCPYCMDGVYTPPPERSGIPIYMQRVHDDIPGSVALPLREISNEFLPAEKKPYFTSSPAYMLGMAMLMGYKKIELYGFDMGTTTEYHYQRACFEYWIGLAHGRGVDITLPGSQIITGLLYGYENMKTGYRQQLEMRKHSLDNQFNETRRKCLILEAKAEALKAINKQLEAGKEVDLDEEFNKYWLELQKTEGILNFVSGARTETNNLTSLYESYFVAGTEEANETDVSAYTDNEVYTNVKYISQDEANGKK